MLLGSGTYSNVIEESIAVKESKNVGIDGSVLIPHQSILEVSILKHLNQYCQTARGSYPQIYSVGAIIRTESPTICTTIKMSNEGRSLYDIWIATNRDQRQPMLMSYIDKILEAIRSIHTIGVIHGDLNYKNILIKNGEVSIIDFGLSSMYTMSDDRRSNRGYFIPEYHYRREYTAMSDIWILGVKLLNLCMGYEYISRDNYNLRQYLSDRYSSMSDDEFDNNMKLGLIHTSIIIPNEIQLDLRIRLRRMLNIHPNDRQYSYRQMVPVRLEQWSYYYRGFDREVIDNFGQLLELFITLASRYRRGCSLHTYHIVVGIDVLARYYRMKQILMNDVNINLIARIVFIICCNCYISQDSLSSIMNGIDIDNIRVSYIQMSILELLDWRIFTVDNTTIACRSAKVLINFIKNDKNRGRYLFYNYQRLKELFESI